MAAKLPDQVYEQGFEDTQSVDLDIDSLFSRFIGPIEQIRSICDAPAGKLQSSQSKFGVTDLAVDPVNKMESRLHAFYRLLGLPVVAGGNCYNPGFNPIPSSSTARDNINSAIPDTDISAMSLREQHPRLFSQMFNGQGFDATLWCLLQAYPKSFNMLDSKTNTKAIDGRDVTLGFLSVFYNALNNTNIVSSIVDGQAAFASRMSFAMTSARHILTPFSVNPAIDFTVMPVSNKVCVPFLPTLQSTKISASPDVFLQRPGIEFIIRSRLKDNNPDTQFLSDIQSVLQKGDTSSTSTVSDQNLLKSAVEALAENNDIDNADLNDIFGTFSSTQAVVVENLIKTMKGTIKLLAESIHQIDKVSAVVTFMPIPNARGIELGGKLLNVSPTTKIEKDIVVLTIKQLNANRSIALDNSFGTFATSGYTDLEKTNAYTEKIDSLNRRKKSLGETGMQALKTIEIVTGEASGLGLIDVLAIYTALWSIKIEDLLGLLDNDAFERLNTYNPDLQAKSISRSSVTAAQTSLQEKISNLLSFADLTFGKIATTSPQEFVSGDPT